MENHHTHLECKFFVQAALQNITACAKPKMNDPRTNWIYYKA